ncbi:MAG: hypothetical protein AABY96_01010 [Nitrospirota bacterium]
MRRTLWYVEPLSDARTAPVDFFSILLTDLTFVSYFGVEGVGAAVVACVAVFDWVLAGGDEGEGAGVAGAAGVDGSEVLGGESFFSPV